jgi:TldD protein
VVAPARGPPGYPSFVLSLLLSLPLYASEVPTEPLSDLQSALSAAMAQLQRLPDPPYYLAYAVTETNQLTLQGTNGAYAGDERSRGRVVDIDLRVGSMKLDNTHKIRDAAWFSEPERPDVRAPIANDPALLRNLLLRYTDDVYRSALRQLIKVRSNDVVKVEREDTSDDFSVATPVQDVVPLPPLVVDEQVWKETLRQVSAIYLQYPAVQDSAVEITVQQERRWLVSNEGAKIADGRNHLRVATWGTAIAADGMQVQVYDYVDGPSLETMPDRKAIEGMVHGVAQRVTALLSAPLVEPYDGPAILRGRAAGVFFHEIFGHRIEGHRQKDEDEGQTFTSRVGQSILPDFLSVYDDPTLSRLGNIDLNGTYRYDDEGVPAQRVPLVEHGVLRNFLMGRAPVANFPTSNGHARRQPGFAPVPRQGNLLIQAERSVPYSKLREMLIEEIRKQKKPFGLIFDDISGGFTFTGRSTPNAFSVQPVTVWKVFADGRPDQLVRGVDLIGTPLTTFSRILAAGDDPEVFNGMCGAESGWVPVSAIAPSLLIQQVEVQRQDKMSDRPPLLPPPGVR